MQQNYPFQPIGAGATTTLSQAVTNANATFTIPPVPTEGATVRLVNDGTSVIFWNFGATAAVAATSTPMLPNTVETFGVPGGTTQISVISTAVSGSTLRVTIGIGS